MKRILLFMAYYGNLPNYFNLWLKAAEFNRSIDFCLITDCIESKESLPSNVRLLPLSFDAFKKKVQDKFPFSISIKTYGRVSQFRPAFAYIFPEEVAGYDWWGFVECDLIFGNMRSFLKDALLTQYDKIFCRGHFMLFRNDEAINILFMKESKKALSYEFAFKKDILFFEEQIGMTNIANAMGCRTYDERLFADVRWGELMFQARLSRFSEEEVVGKCMFEYLGGVLYEISILNGEVARREILYCHLQKRAMDVSIKNASRFCIIPNKFVEYRRITREYFDEIEEGIKDRETEYRTAMKKKQLDAKVNRYKHICWWQLKLKQIGIKAHGGLGI